MNSVGLGSSSRLEPIFASIADKYERFQRYPQEGFRSAERLIEVEPIAGVTLVGKIDAVFEPDDARHQQALTRAIGRIAGWQPQAVAQARHSTFTFASLCTTGITLVYMEIFLLISSSS